MNLNERIALGESEILDFKYRIDHPQKIARSIAAFANHLGGSLLVGIKDNKRPAKINIEEEFHMMQAAAQMHLKPEIKLSYKETSYLGFPILEVIIPKAEEQFYQAKNEKGQWQYYLRVLDHSMPANSIIIKSKLIQKSLKTQPTKASDLKIISLLKNETLSLNQIIKLSGLSPQKTKSILTQLIAWKLVDFHLTDQGCSYSSF